MTVLFTLKMSLNIQDNLIICSFNLFFYTNLNVKVALFDTPSLYLKARLMCVCMYVCMWVCVYALTDDKVNLSV
jgi:hypothetical protein